MSLTQQSLSAKIVKEFENQGANASGQYSWVTKMADAIAQAVVDEIQSNAEVNVTGGSSSGTYKVQ